MKIDTHCHLGGSIDATFVWDVIKENGWKHLAESYEDVYNQMTFAKNERRTFHRFLDKFRILDKIIWTPESIRSSIKSVCDNLKNNCIDYTWMDFSINKYLDNGIKWHKHEMIEFIYDAFEEFYPDGVGLILSLKYESTRASQHQYAKLIEHEIANKCLIGIDLVGDEEYFESDFYRSILSDWVKSGKIVRAHVGESQSIENIKSAIEELQVTNIAHGFKIISDQNMMQLAIDKAITFDLAITSNHTTGVLQVDTEHPGVKMLDFGIKCTLGSDDPVQCSTHLDNEFAVAHTVGFRDHHLKIMRATAIENSKPFLKR